MRGVHCLLNAMNPHNLGPITTTTARKELGLGHRHQVQKLVNAGLLAVVGTVGRTQLLDPTDLATLKAYAPLPTPSAGTLAGIAVSTDGLAPDLHPKANGRRWAGWTHPRVTNGPSLPESQRLKAFESWWLTGEELADELVGLPLVETTSGFVGEVRVIEGHNPHPVTPGLTWFTTAPAPKQIEMHYLGHRIAFGRGAPWRRLFH
jgi:hypothetical protein